jgi:F-type H+-transporting ATPase subunit a
MTLASTVGPEAVVEGPVLASVSSPPDGYVPPSIGEFFYDPIIGSGVFAINRIVLMMLLMTGVLCLVFGLGFRRPQVVPRGLQNVLETGTEFVRTQIGDEVIGKEASRGSPPT